MSTTGTNTLRYLTLGFTVLAFVCNLIAFLSPYWLESNPTSNSQFVRLGLWVACFDGYLHWSDYVNKAYFGCWYIYYPEYDLIRHWLNPAWFYLVQMLSIVAFVSHCLAMLIVGCQSCAVLARDGASANLIVTFCHFAAATGLMVALLAVGINARDTRWMPWPERNRLGYAYYFAVLSLAASVAAFFVLFLRYMARPSHESKQRAMRAQRMAPPGAMFDPRANPRVGGSYYGDVDGDGGATVQPLAPQDTASYQYEPNQDPYAEASYYERQEPGASYYSGQSPASPMSLYENEKRAYDEHGNVVTVHGASANNQLVEGNHTEDSAV